MEVLVILGAIATVITALSQLSTLAKNIMDMHFKLKEEKEKSRSGKEDDSK